MFLLKTVCTSKVLIIVRITQHALLHCAYMSHMIIRNISKILYEHVLFHNTYMNVAMSSLFDNSISMCLMSCSVLQECPACATKSRESSHYMTLLYDVTVAIM